MSLFLFIPSFMLAAFLAFYIPGRVVLSGQKSLPKVGIFASSFILGIVMWGWQGYLFGFLHLRWLSYLYLIIFLLLFLKQKYFHFNLPKIHFKNIDWITGLMFVIGIAGQTFQFVRSGQAVSQGLFIGGNNPPDQVWHVTLIGELVRRFPPNEPGMFGILLTNYHFWFHLVTADIIRVFHLPLFQTQFIGMYALGSLLLAFIAYSLATSIYNSKLFLRLIIFFLFFSGDATGWFMLLLRHNFNLNTNWLFEDGTNFMDAPGRGFAVLIALAGSYLLFKFKEKLSWRLILVVGFLFGSLLSFKIYIGIPFIGGLFVFAIVKCLKRDFSLLWAFVIACVLSLAQFLPFNSSSGGLFFLPLDIPREFLSQKIMHLGFIDQRWKIYLAHNNYPRLIEYGIIMTIIYLCSQFGVKIFGLFPLKKTIKVLGGSFYVFLYSALLTSLIFGLFFYQRVGGANIWEFFLATSPVLAILVSLNIALYLSKSKIIAYTIIFLIISFAIPRWIDSVNRYFRIDYLSGFHGISNSEIYVYDYLRNKTPKNSQLLLVGEPTYVDYSSIASIFSERNLFFSGSGVSQLITSEYARRQKDADFINISKDDGAVKSILQKDNVDYVVLYDTHITTNSALLKNRFIKKVFSNQSAKIFKVEN